MGIIWVGDKILVPEAVVFFASTKIMSKVGHNFFVFPPQEKYCENQSVTLQKKTPFLLHLGKVNIHIIIYNR